MSFNSLRPRTAVAKRESSVNGNSRGVMAKHIFFVLLCVHLICSRSCAQTRCRAVTFGDLLWSWSCRLCCCCDCSFSFGTVQWHLVFFNRVRLSFGSCSLDSSILASRLPALVLHRCKRQQHQRQQGQALAGSNDTKYSSIQSSPIQLTRGRRNRQGTTHLVRTKHKTEREENRKAHHLNTHTHTN